MTFYDRYGNAVAYEDDGIFLFSGEPIAFIHGDAVYTYSGVQLGWFSKGWIRDLNGNCVLYSEASAGIGPVKPVRRVAPVRHAKKVKPAKSVCQLKEPRPIDTMYWSNLTPEGFFHR